MMHKFFFKENDGFFSLAFTLINLFEIQTSCCFTCYSIFLEEPLNCVCTQLSIRVIAFIKKIVYPIQNYVQIPIGSCLFLDKFLFLSDVLSRMLQMSCRNDRKACFRIKFANNIIQNNSRTKPIYKIVYYSFKCMSLRGTVILGDTKCQIFNSFF